MVSGRLLDAAEERLPTTPGTCVLTEISTISSRLAKGRTRQPIPGSGSAVTFNNKGYQVSYAEEPAILHSRRGDKVYMCLMQVPRDDRAPSRGVGAVILSSVGRSIRLPQSAE
jgi:hypothetical protein